MFVSIALKIFRFLKLLEYFMSKILSYLRVLLFATAENAIGIVFCIVLASDKSIDGAVDVDKLLILL